MYSHCNSSPSIEQQSTDLKQNRKKQHKQTINVIAEVFFLKYDFYLETCLQSRKGLPLGLAYTTSTALHYFTAASLEHSLDKSADI